LSDEEFARFSDQIRGFMQGILGFAEHEGAASGPPED